MLILFNFNNSIHYLCFKFNNYKYTSPNIQNKIISASGNLILDKIVKEVNVAKCFSVLVDKTTDVSVKEQLTLCVRCVVGSGKDVYLNEKF